MSLVQSLTVETRPLLAIAGLIPSLACNRGEVTSVTVTQDESLLSTLFTLVMLNHDGRVTTWFVEVSQEGEILTPMTSETVNPLH